jgi:outer membrane protein TolC
MMPPFRVCSNLLLSLASFLLGCQATLPDVPRDAARLTGIDNAISFKDEKHEDVAPAPEQTLELPHAVRLALKHDPRIGAAMAKVRIAEADANQARLLPNPIVTIDYRFATRPDQNSVFEPSISADLLSLLQKPAQIAAADNRLRGAASSALVTVLDVISEVQETYIAACSADAEIENAERRRDRIQKLRDLAKQRLELGQGTRLDLLTLESQLLQATLAVNDVKLTRQQERVKLARLLGFPRDAAKWHLTLPQPPSADGASTAEESWIDAALRNRPEIQLHRWELRALGADLSGANFAAFQGADIGVHGERDPHWRVGPTLTTPLPIFDFGQAARAKIRASQTVAANELLQQQREVIQDVRLAYAAYHNARETLGEYQQKLLPLQQAQTDQAEFAYKAAEADLAILLLAQNELELTRSKIIELQEKLLVARIKLQRAAGGAGIAAELERPATQPSSATRPTTGPTP